FVGQELTRRLMRATLERLNTADKLQLFPAPGLGRWARRLGIGGSAAHERIQWLLEQLNYANARDACRQPPVGKLCIDAQVQPDLLLPLMAAHQERTQPHDTAGMMRRHIYMGFVRSALQGDETELANFLTYGFAELDFRVRPNRQDLVLAVLKVLM